MRFTFEHFWKFLFVSAFCFAPVRAADIATARSFNITDFGAVGDGKAMNTSAFSKAIEACDGAGGGRLIVPAGTFLTGPIELRSGIDLHVEPDATVLFSRNRDDYPLTAVSFEGKDTIECRSPISGKDLHDVSITGAGTFDGSGDAWRPVKKSKLDDKQWDALVKSGGIVDDRAATWYPSDIWRTGKDDLTRLRQSSKPPVPQDYASFRDMLRPSLLLLTNCTNVLLDGPTFRNSPCWNLHPYLCDGLTVRHITVFNEEYAQNGDGIDIDSCRNVVVEDSTFNAGDDGICIKSGRDEEGRRRGKPTENVTITRCTVGHAHGGVVIGSEMSGGVRNINVSDCTFKGTDTGLRFKSTRGRGGIVEDIHVNNVNMSEIRGDAIIFDMYYMVKNPQPEPVSERTPIFRKFTISNITCQGAKRAMTVRGLPEMPIEQITFEKVRISADAGVNIVDAKDITLSEVHIESASEPVIQSKNAVNITTDTFEGVVRKP